MCKETRPMRRTRTPRLSTLASPAAPDPCEANCSALAASTPPAHLHLMAHMVGVWLLPRWYTRGGQGRVAQAVARTQQTLCILCSGIALAGGSIHRDNDAACRFTYRRAKEKIS